MKSEESSDIEANNSAPTKLEPLEDVVTALEPFTDVLTVSALLCNDDCLKPAK